MTLTDPYPEHLSELDDAPNTVSDVDRLVRALNRIAAALEHPVNLRQPSQNGSGPALAPLPPIQTAPVAAGGVCPIHGTPWKVVPAGVSKKTGKAYQAFTACSTQGCDQRP